jgi:hypothetical protein
MNKQYINFDFNKFTGEIIRTFRLHTPCIDLVSFIKYKDFFISCTAESIII